MSASDDQQVTSDVASELREIKSMLALICSVLHLAPQTDTARTSERSDNLRTKNEIDNLAEKMVARAMKRRRGKKNGTTQN